MAEQPRVPTFSRRAPTAWTPKAPWARSLAQLTVDPISRARIYENLADKVAVGHKLRDAVEQEAYWMSVESPWDMRAIMLHQVIERMDDGEPFHRALQGYARDTEQLVLSSMVQVQDHAGVLRQAVRCLTVAEAIKSQYLKMALVPAIALPAIVGILVLLAVKIVPMLENSIPPERWAGIAAVLRAIARFTLSPWAWVALVLALILVVLSILSLPRWTGRVRRRLEGLPPWSAYKAMVGAQWLIMLGGMLASGQKLVESLEQMNRSAQPWLKERVNAILELVHSGTKFGKALHRTGFNFPESEVVRTLASSADLPNFDAILIRTGERWLERSQQQVAAQVARTARLVIIIIYIIIATVIVGILSMVGALMGDALVRP